MDLEPEALHGEPNPLEVNPRKLNIEAHIHRQIDRIGYLRSIGEDWTEPLFHLRDLVTGLEDDEFWKGVPANVDKDSLTESDLQEYTERGWDGVVIDVELVEVEDGVYVENPVPTPTQLSKIFRMVMALLARRGMSWRSMINDEIPTHIPVTDD